MTLWRLFGRGFLLVFLVAVQTRLLAGHSWLSLPVCGAIQFVWWHNTKTSVITPHKAAPYVYAAGAMTGTGLALWLT